MLVERRTIEKGTNVEDAVWSESLEYGKGAFDGET